MTGFAGVVALTAGAQVPDDLARGLAAALSRDSADVPQILSGQGFFIAKLDLGLLGGQTCWCDGDGTAAVLAGEPLLGGTATAQQRTLDLRAIHGAWRGGDLSPLHNARGSFCSAHVDPVRRTVSLISDRLGLRPIYFALQEGYFVFATALRVLESVPGITRTLDLRGTAEISAFGFPLGTRTAYAQISTIDAAEVVTCSASSLERSHYSRWHALPVSELSPADLNRALFERFRDSIARRLGNQRSVVAFLSGGLDSRCIVACLRSLGVEVHTMNFAPQGSADLVLGRMAAEALQTRHFESPEGPLEFWDRMARLHEAWQARVPAHERPERARALWSGDGGSCCMGHIYLTEQIIQLMREDAVDAAIEVFCRYNGIGLPRRAFVRAGAAEMVDIPRSGIREELANMGSGDPGRRLHLFLLHNGQRRLLARHYEDIDRRRFELVTPFFDPYFLELVLSSPIDPFLRHRLYVRWLREFPAALMSVPWQAYPGHEPCPLPQPPGLRAQWDSWYTSEERRALVREDLAEMGRVLADPHFPGWLLDRRTLQLACWLTRLRVGDYRYMFKVARDFTRYAARAGDPKGAAAPASLRRSTPTQ